MTARRDDGGLDGVPIEVRAAGGVVWRPGDAGPELLVVHRPKYDDWTFPKGKLDPGERWSEAALREVEEEAGVRCALHDELARIRYRDQKGRAKEVRYWVMTVLGGSFTPNREVDEVRWLDPGSTRRLLTYDRDGVVLTSFQSLAELR